MRCSQLLAQHSLTSADSMSSRPVFTGLSGVTLLAGVVSTLATTIGCQTQSTIGRFDTCQIQADQLPGGRETKEMRRQFDIGCIAAATAFDKVMVVHGSRVLVIADESKGSQVPLIRVVEHR